MLNLLHSTRVCLCVLLHRRNIDSKAALTVVPGLVDQGLIPYGTNKVEFLEANKYECGISCLVFGYGMDPELMGMDVDAHR